MRAASYALMPRDSRSPHTQRAGDAPDALPEAPSVSQRFLTKTTSYFLQKLPWHEQKSLWAEDAALPLL